MSKKEISEIVIINDFNCTFIGETIAEKSAYKTNAFHKLLNLKIDNIDLINIETDNSKKKGILSELNIAAQLENLSKEAPISNRDILISAYVNDRNNDSFKWISSLNFEYNSTL
jgi:hypothetical protein